MHLTSQPGQLRRPSLPPLTLLETGLQDTIRRRLHQVLTPVLPRFLLGTTARVPSGSPSFSEFSLSNLLSSVRYAASLKLDAALASAINLVHHSDRGVQYASRDRSRNRGIRGSSRCLGRRGSMTGASSLNRGFELLPRLPQRLEEVTIEDACTMANVRNSERMQPEKSGCGARCPSLPTYVRHGARKELE